MSREQIEEMAKHLRYTCEGECFRNKDGFIDCDVCRACDLYDAGYRKQSEGEWIDHSEIGTMNCSWECSGCHWTTVSFTEMKHSKYCPNCGAKMKGGAR